MERLIQLFTRWAGEPPAQCLQLGAGGSSRRYYRLTSSATAEGLRPLSVIGCIADDLRENEAFFSYSRQLRHLHLPVPELYIIDNDRRHYLQQDLGDATLYSILYEKKRQGGGFDTQMLSLYKQALSDLVSIQDAGPSFDFSLAYPRPYFDRQSILWDLNYFKYHFLKLAHIPFHEQALEDDFNTFASLLLQADCRYFLYRDFNPRNIMVTNDQSLYYIDYQGARCGAAQYDVASLLYSAKSDLPSAIRNELLNHYLLCRNLHGEQRRTWLHHFHLYLYLRILQTLGAYGYRGLFERKDYFLHSIPLALRNLSQLTLEHPEPLAKLPELTKVISAATNLSHPSFSGTDAVTPNDSSLTVLIQSFSYKQGLPSDDSGNGGGHIFDCRALPNPGRYPQYKQYTGKDRPVVDFLRQQPPVDLFLQHAQAIVSQSIEKYLERHFTHLSVSFGCTGGQHRSVYCAETLAANLKEKYPEVIFTVRHREQDR